jgi:hypothetical protein
MEKEFVSYDLSVKLKKLGFNEPCCGYYDNSVKELDTISSEVCERLCKHDTHIKAPTFSQAFRWFREIKEVEYQITYAGAKGRYNSFVEDYLYDNNGDLKEFTYEEAELACLEKLIEIVENK